LAEKVGNNRDPGWGIIMTLIQFKWGMDVAPDSFDHYVLLGELDAMDEITECFKYVAIVLREGLGFYV
jgi:hypothetical protein